MLTHRQVCAFFLILIPVILIFAGTATATYTSFTVQEGKEEIYPIKLANEDRVLIQFTVIGGNNTLQFSIAFSNGTVIDYGETGLFHLSFVSTFEGECLLNFTNNDLGDSKQVTLDYEIDHYTFGMPQMLFMTIVIAVVCVAGVAVFIGLSRKPY